MTNLNNENLAVNEVIKLVFQNVENIRDIYLTHAWVIRTDILNFHNLHDCVLRVICSQCSYISELDIRVVVPESYKDTIISCNEFIIYDIVT
jgi:hypothetical protein